MRYSKTRGREFNESYKNELFLLWFKNHKPSAKRLDRMIPEEWGEDKPSQKSLNLWIKEIFKPRAVVLDRQMQDELEGRLIQEKVEMLYRHGGIGRKMQGVAMEKLDEIDPQDLSSHAAVRLLVEGVRIERESVGLPQALEKMLSSEDEEILDRIEQLTETSQADILVIDDDEFN